MRSRKAIVVMLCVALLGVPGIASADIIIGEIGAVDPGRSLLSLILDSGREYDIEVPTSAVFDGFKSLSELFPGDHVSVQAFPNQEGNLEAKSIEKL